MALLGHYVNTQIMRDNKKIFNLKPLVQKEISGTLNKLKSFASRETTVCVLFVWVVFSCHDSANNVTVSYI